MSGLTMDMGLGAGGGYSGPVFSAAGVRGSGGYPDTAPRAATISELAFGPGSGAPAGNAGKHAIVFGLLCFGALIFMAATLPR